MQIQSFKEIAQNYKVIFFDSYGVLKNYNGLIEGVPEVLQSLKSEQKEYFVLTNDASRSPKTLVQSLYKAGLTHVKEEYMITSGMMATQYLRQKVKRGKVVYMGPEKSAYYISALGLEPIHLNDLDQHPVETIKAFLFLDDEGFDWFSTINSTINLLRKHNIPVIVANTDLVYPISKESVSLAIGGIANLIEHTVQKHFIKFGKPDSQMFMYAFDLLKGKGIEKEDILMVGDTLHTDILGGNKFGLDTVLVLTGNTLPSQYALKINNTGIKPTYVCESIAS